jgi:ribosomal protein L17
MAITTKGRADELKKIKEKIIKMKPMGKTAQKEAAMKKFPERKFNAKALIESLQDEKTPMKKTRLEDSVRGKKMVFKKSGGRIGLKAGSKGCKLAKKGRGRAYGKNS